MVFSFAIKLEAKVFLLLIFAQEEHYLFWLHVAVLRVITEELTVTAIQLPCRLEPLFSKKQSSDIVYSLPKDLLTHLQSIVSKFTLAQWSKKQEHRE